MAYQGTALTKEEFFKKQEDIPVEVSPPDPSLRPLEHFQKIPPQWGVHQALIQNCVYQKPTPVQKWGIPLLMKGKDVMASAQTGSGKTAFFLFPSINMLLNNQQGRGDGWHDNKAAIKVLIMAPTRELCSQIHEEAEKFVRGTSLLLACVYGGVEYKNSLNAIRNGNDIMVATPGRLNDMVERKHVTLAKIQMLILDEADRMLDIGFEPQIRNIVERQGMPRRRQTCMTSATFPEGVQFLAQDFLKDYVFVAVGQVGAAATTIKQKIVWVDDDEKDSYLYGILLHQKQIGLTLIFVNMKTGASDLERFLQKMGIRAVSIHGDKTQAQREANLQEFKDKRTQVMIATDVAARGLDIPDVAWVVQYDCALSSDDFVHRVGRTGRIGNMGMAITFANNRCKGTAHEILDKLEKSGNAVPNWLKGMAISTGNYGQTEQQTTNGYGGQDFRKQQRDGFKTKEEKEAAKKYTNFHQNAYGEGDVNKARDAAAQVGPQGMTFEQMAQRGKLGGNMGGKGGGGKGPKSGKGKK